MSWESQFEPRQVGIRIWVTRAVWVNPVEWVIPVEWETRAAWATLAEWVTRAAWETRAAWVIPVGEVRLRAPQLAPALDEGARKWEIR